MPYISVKQLMLKATEKYGKVDILINHVGISPRAAGIDSTTGTHDLPLAYYKKLIEINQDGVFLSAKYAIREMLKSGGGSIVNTVSIMGHVGNPGAFAYNASKGAVNLMTKGLALEYADKNIRVNAVCPGYVESGMTNKTILGDRYDEIVALHPIGRLGKAEEIAHAIIFLCENDFMTGSSLIIDGGYTAQ